MSVLYAFAAACFAAALIGALLRLPRPLSAALSGYSASITGAILIFIALGHLAPEAARMTRTAMLAVALGVGAGFLVDRLASRTFGGNRAGWTVLAGLALHSVVDGLVFTASMHAHAAAGLGAALGIVIHKVPAAFIVTSLARASGAGPVFATTCSILVIGGVSALAAFSAPWVMADLQADDLGLVLGGSAGLLVYSGTAMTWRETRRFTPGRGVAFGATCLLMLAATLVLPDVHSHAGHQQAHTGAACPERPGAPSPGPADCPAFAKRPGAAAP